MGDDGGSSAEGRAGAVGGIAFARVGEGFIGVIRVGFQRISDLRMLSGRAANVAVAFEDLFSRDVRGVVEERRVVEDRLEVLWHLCGRKESSAPVIGFPCHD